MAVMLFCIALQVVMRYVFAQTPSWSEELAILMFAWCALGGLALGVREGFHVRMDLLLDRLSPLAVATSMPRSDHKRAVGDKRSNSKSMRT